MMNTTLQTINKIITNVLTAFYEPFGFSILLSVFVLFFYLYAYDPSGAGKGWKEAIRTWLTKFKASAYFRKLFLLSFIVSLILFRTLLNRNMWMNPLSKIMGGWWIWETAADGTRTLTTECIENVLMMIPFTAVLMWTMADKILKERNLRNILIKSVKITFCFSLGIETFQLILRVGTFQLSDIVYNTFGGAIGGLLYWLVCRVRGH